MIFLFFWGLNCFIQRIYVWALFHNPFLQSLLSFFFFKKLYLTKSCPWIDVHHINGSYGLLFGHLNHNTKKKKKKKLRFEDSLFSDIFHQLGHVVPHPFFGFFSVRSWISHMPMPLIVCVGLHWNLGNPTHTCCCH